MSQEHFDAWEGLSHEERKKLQAQVEGLAFTLPPGVTAEGVLDGLRRHGVVSPLLTAYGWRPEWYTEVAVARLQHERHLVGVKADAYIGMLVARGDSVDEADVRRTFFCCRLRQPDQDGLGAAVASANGVLLVDEWRGSFVEVPETHAPEYAYVRFLFIEDKGAPVGEVAMPRSVPRWWIDDVSVPGSPGVVWFFDSRDGGQLLYAEYWQPEDGGDGVWELEGFGDTFGVFWSQGLSRHGRSFMGPSDSFLAGRAISDWRGNSL